MSDANNLGDSTASDGDTFAKDDESQETRSADKMGALETEDFEADGKAEVQNHLGRAKAIPCIEDTAVALGEAERHAEVHHGRDEVQADHDAKRKDGAFVMPNVQHDAGVLDGETQSRDHEDNGCTEKTMVRQHGVL